MIDTIYTLYSAHQSWVHVIAAVIGIKFILNLRALLQLSSYSRKYDNYIATSSLDFHRHIPHIEVLFRKAGMGESQFTSSELTGFGYAKVTKARLLANIHIINDNVVPSILLYFSKSRGVYRKRMWNAICPFYWIDTIIFLPKAVLGYLGMPAVNWAVKVFQLIYWGAMATYAILKLIG